MKILNELMDAEPVAQPAAQPAATDHIDDARLGLVKEMLQIVMGLETETLDRVMRLIRGSEDAQDIKTPEMRQRIGPRAMRYLRNAIDLAREEGSEYHNTDPDIDVSKTSDIEPGHKHEHGMGGMKESFKGFLVNETTAMIDTDDPDAIAKLKQKQRLGGVKTANQNVADAADAEKAARETPSPTANLEAQKQRHLKAAALVDKKLAGMRKREEM